MDGWMKETLEADTMRYDAVDVWMCMGTCGVIGLVGLGWVEYIYNVLRCCGVLGYVILYCVMFYKRYLTS